MLPIAEAIKRGEYSQVATLTDPGRPVPRYQCLRRRCVRIELRSSPTPEGRCCAMQEAIARLQDGTMRSSPTLEGRCCRSPPRRR